MFGFLNEKKKQSIQSLTSSSDNDFAEALNNAKNKVKNRDEKRNGDSNYFYESALELINNFNYTKDDNDLKEAASFLSNALKQQRNKVECYFWLAYIFYVFGENKLCFEYIRIAESIDPTYPKIKQFKNILSEV